MISQINNIQRIELLGLTGTELTTTVETLGPVLLQPIREDFASTSGVGELRIGAQPDDYVEVGATKMFPEAWTNGDIYL